MAVRAKQSRWKLELHSSSAHQKQLANTEISLVVFVFAIVLIFYAIAPCLLKIYFKQCALICKHTSTKPILLINFSYLETMVQYYLNVNSLYFLFPNVFAILKLNTGFYLPTYPLFEHLT